MHMRYKKKIYNGVGLALCLMALVQSCAILPNFSGYKKQDDKASRIDTAVSTTSYQKLKDGARIDSGMFTVLIKDEDYYFGIPKTAFDKDFLLIHKVSSVPLAINEAGVNKGMNFENKVIRFMPRKNGKEIWVGEYDPKVDVKHQDAIAYSVADNYRASFIESFKVVCYDADSTTAFIKVNKVFDGSEKSFLDVFANLGLGTSPNKAISSIEQMKSFDNNIVIKSIYSTKVTEGNASIPISISVTSNIYGLPEQPMRPRFSDPRVGFFTTPRWYFSDKQQELEKRELVTRWRLEPKEEDRDRYLRGELVEPQKPIVFYIDPATPKQWRTQIIAGVYDWQVAFEAAGFKNAIVAKQLPDTVSFDPDDANVSSIVYAASSQANAMGPSVVDPRSGEILEADVIWWHNVMTVLNSWMRIQTGIIDTAARGNTFSDEKMAHAIRFVSSHEIGHTLGLMHNMGSSHAFPVDSLRSPSFTEKMGGTATSIMDYARFNYVAQPEDGVQVITPVIGLYDKYAIEWAYRWYDVDTPWEELPTLRQAIEKHQHDPNYWYGEQQDSKNVVDPRAQSEDLGDNAMLAGRYGLRNLKRMMPQIIEWTTAKGENYYKAGKLYMGGIGQWYTYADHVVNNIGGIYLENPVLGDGKSAYSPVSRATQEEAFAYLEEQVLRIPSWLFVPELMTKTFPLRDSPAGVFEYAPYNLQREFQYSLLYSLVRDERLLRMIEMEKLFGSEMTWTAMELFDALRKVIFEGTIQKKNLDLDTRMLQQNYIDVLMVSSNKTMEKINEKKIQEVNALLTAVNPSLCPWHEHGQTETRLRNVHVTGMARTSDMLTLKRGELLRIYELLKKASNTGNAATTAHYEDLLLRIGVTLNMNN